MQDGTFDHPDRAFHTVKGCWTSASSGDPNDIRELVPEFYYLPDFLTNSNRFILGESEWEGMYCTSIRESICNSHDTRQTPAYSTNLCPGPSMNTL